MKKTLFLIAIVVTVLSATSDSNAQPTFVVASPQATVRGGASAALDILEQISTPTLQSGTVSIKYDTTLDSARKHYVKVNLTGQNPNTNGPLYIQYNTGSSSQRQNVQLWSLDQIFAGMASTLTWNTAQANDTNSGSALLTAGGATATAYGTFLSSASASAVGVIHQLNYGPWGHMIRSDGAAYLAFTSIENIGNNGLRLVTNTLALGFEPITTGTPPVLGVVTNSLAANGLLTVVQGAKSTATNYFTVADVETTLSGLAITNSTSNEASLSTTNVIVDGIGATRTVYLTAAPTALPGTNTVVLYLVDADGNRAVRQFTVIVQQFNVAPSIIVGTSTNAIAPTNTLVDTAVTIPFGVSDPESPAAALTVSANVATYSAAVLATATVNGAGPNTNLSLTITPQPGVDGVGVVQLNCADTNGNTTTVSFCIMVRSNAAVAFVDHFDYNASNTKLTDDAPRFWTRRNASAQSVFLRSGTDPVSNAKVAWIRPNSGAEDLAAPLVGGPYSPSSRAVLYTKFNATFADQAAGGPGINIITNNDAAAAFFRLSQGATSTTDFVGYILNMTNNAADPANQFRIAVGNGTGTSAVTMPLDLNKPVNLATETGPITIVSRYDVEAAKATLWVNGTSESDPSVSATDDQVPVSVGYVGLFQARGYGDIYIDDMTVTVKIKPLITSVAPPAGGNLTIDFNAGATDGIADFQLQRASTVNGAFANVAAAIVSLGGGNFRATVATAGSEGYYKVKRTPVTF